MIIHVESPALEGGAADLEVDRVTGGRELPATRAGIRGWADITITTSIGSVAHRALQTIAEARESRLRIKGYEGSWLVKSRRMPGIPSDGLARVILVFAG